MIVKTYKIFSYCDDFTEEQQEILSDENSCDVFIQYTAGDKKWHEEKGYSNSEIGNRLVEQGAENGEEVLIHLDW